MHATSTLTVPGSSHGSTAGLSARSYTSSVFTISGFKQRFASFKAAWGPCMAAKESWEEEYNFPAGRWAGQGLDPTWYRVVA
ncbi:uncharacterized protein BDV14DRAFT_177817 [Aspergillus stella-maris]|uniref:uncharacterized protein n=1 Tax=Aspergillus stella-maris TaxID=1810926 RepID=UPI003CCCCB46